MIEQTLTFQFSSFRPICSTFKLKRRQWARGAHLFSKSHTGRLQIERLLHNVQTLIPVDPVKILENGH